MHKQCEQGITVNLFHLRPPKQILYIINRFPLDQQQHKSLRVK